MEVCLRLGWGGHLGVALVGVPMKNICKALLLVIVFAAGASLGACTTGLESGGGGGGGDTPIALNADSFYPIGGDKGVPLDVGVAAMIFPANYALNLEASEISDDTLVLYDAGPTPSADIVALPAIDASFGTKVDGEAGYDPAYEIDGATYNAAAVVPTRNLLKGHTYNLVMTGPVSGVKVDGETETPLLLAEGETIVVTWDTPPLWRSIGSELYEEFQKVTVLPENRFAAAGSTMTFREVRSSFLKVFNPDGSVAGEDTIDPVFPGKIMVVFGVAYSDGAIYVAGRCGNTDDENSVWFARYAVADDGSITRTNFTGIQNMLGGVAFSNGMLTGFAMDSEDNIYLSGLLKPSAADFYTGIIRKYALVGANFEMVDSLEKDGGDITQMNTFGGMTIYTKDGVDHVIVGGVFSSAIAMTGGLYRYSADLDRMSQYEREWDPMDALIDMTVVESQDLIYAAGSRMVGINDTDALISSYRLSSMMGSGAVPDPTVKSVTRNPIGKNENSFNSVAAGYEGSIIVAGYCVDDEIQSSMVVEKFDSNLELVRSRTDYNAGRVHTEGYGVAVDSWGNILVAGEYDELATYSPTAWKFDRNLNGSYVNP